MVKTANGMQDVFKMNVSKICINELKYLGQISLDSFNQSGNIGNNNATEKELRLHKKKRRKIMCMHTFLDWNREKDAKKNSKMWKEKAN